MLCRSRVNQLYDFADQQVSQVIDSDKRCSMKVLTKDGKAPKIKKYGPKEKMMVVPPQKPQDLMIKEGNETRLIEFSAAGTVSHISLLTGAQRDILLMSPKSQQSAPQVVESTYQSLLNVENFVQTSYRKPYNP